MTNRQLWCEEEDAALLEAVQKNGARKWGQIAAFVKGRTGKQCRERWYHHVDPAIIKGQWTDAEDKKILELVASYGRRWAVIARCLKGRTDNSVKNRYESFLKHLPDAPEPAAKTTVPPTYRPPAHLRTNVKGGKGAPAAKGARSKGRSSLVSHVDETPSQPRRPVQRPGARSSIRRRRRVFIPDTTILEIESDLSDSEGQSSDEESENDGLSDDDEDHSGDEGFKGEATDYKTEDFEVAEVANSSTSSDHGSAASSSDNNVRSISSSIGDVYTKGEPTDPVCKIELLWAAAMHAEQLA